MPAVEKQSLELCASLNECMLQPGGGKRALPSAEIRRWPPAPAPSPTLLTQKPSRDG